MSKVWFITGCSTGFGRELAKYVLESGHQAVVASRKTEDVADIVSDYPDTAIAVKLDVTKADEIKSSLNEAIKKFGHIDVLVNNAGIMITKLLKDTTDEDFTRQFDINVRGTFMVTKHCVPFLKKATL